MEIILTLIFFHIFCKLYNFPYLYFNNDSGIDSHIIRQLDYMYDTLISDTYDIGAGPDQITMKVELH